MKRLFISFLFLAAGAIAAFGQPAVNPDSTRIEEVFDQYFRDVIKLSPEAATQFGFPPESDYEYDLDGLDDISDTGLQASFNLARKYLGLLKGIDGARITPSQKTDAEILTWCLELQLEGEKFINHGYQIDHLFGIHSRLTGLLTASHTIHSIGDADNYLRRLEKIPGQIRRVMRRIDSQEKMGIRPPIFVTDRLITSVEDFIRPEAASNLLSEDFGGKLAEVSGIDSLVRVDYCRRAESIVKDSIYPVYGEFLKQLKTAAESADSLAGIWKLPDGDDYYRYCLKVYTTSSISPDEIFRIGQKEVKSIQDRARILLDSLGIRGDKSYGELMNAYRARWSEPEWRDIFYYPDDSLKEKRILHDYQMLIDSAFLLLPQAFSQIPGERVIVQPVPAYSEAGGISYYSPRTVDGSKEATFFVNMTQLLAKPNMRSLVYHETVPGHHFQIALQHELTSGRMFKNLFFLSGFGEGWAMYAEDLAAELGWQPDIYSRLAELNSQLFRAVRIVLDAGIHHERWTREQAMKYMKDNLGWSAETEIDRYIVWPGQACSYMLGKLRIMDLRKDARERLGPKFDLKEFHMTVLRNGSVPLDMLEGVVEEYIRAKGEA